MRGAEVVSFILGLMLLAAAIAFASSDSPMARTSEGHIAAVLAIIMGVAMIVSTLLESEARKRRASTRGSTPGPVTERTGASANPPQCPRCGKDVLDEYVICPYCGLTLRVECPACGRPLQREFTVCPYCGQKVKGSAVVPELSSAPAVKSGGVPVRTGKRRKAVVAGLAVLVLVGGGLAGLWTFIHRPVSAAENHELWARAHTALFGFVGEGMKAFGGNEPRPATAEGLSQLARYLRDFKAAVKRLAGVTPPPEQVVMHRALLPVYQEMGDHMGAIKDALLCGDALRAELEWHRLALLLDRVAGVAGLFEQDGR